MKRFEAIVAEVAKAAPGSRTEIVQTYLKTPALATPEGKVLLHARALFVTMLRVNKVWP